MDWLTDETHSGVQARRFDLNRDGRLIPGMVWSPEHATGVRPLVLVGHGAGGNKTEDYVVSLARRLVRHQGFAVVAIDGPVHGDRREDGGLDSNLAFLEFSQTWSADPDMTDDMVADWHVTIDALQQLDNVGSGPVGWWGLSMGTIIGVPVVAADRRISVAVLGLMGLVGPTKVRIARDATSIACPVLFLMQLEDELFKREPTLALFDALGSSDKRLHANPGGHIAVPADEFAASEQFLALHLNH